MRHHLKCQLRDKFVKYTGLMWTFCAYNLSMIRLARTIALLVNICITKILLIDDVHKYHMFIEIASNKASSEVVRCHSAALQMIVLRYAADNYRHQSKHAVCVSLKLLSHQHDLWGRKNLSLLNFRFANQSTSSYRCWIGYSDDTVTFLKSWIWFAIVGALRH